MTLHALLGESLLTLSVAAQRRRVSYGSMDETMVWIGAAVGTLFVLLMLIAMVRRFLFICGPHEILVFSGRKAQLKDGSVTNYKIMHGGRGFRRPFVESVRRMDMRLFPVEVTVQNAYSAGGIPLTVRAIANVKLSNNDTKVRNAVERFLDYHPSQIATAAQQTLEGVLREVVSQLTPEEVNEDRLKFADSLIENARDDFDKLGLELDVLKVQHVSDDQEYLANLGRARIANMLRDAENAENAANQAVAEAKAAAREAAETATKQAETLVVEAKNNAQADVAQLNATAKEAENQALMAAETARMVAEQRLQQLRAQMEKLRLHNDVVLPAEAQRKAAELKAAGEAAPAIENGKAGAEALRLVAAEWEAGGAQSRDVYVLQQLGTLAEVAAQRVARSEIGNIKMVANDDTALGAVLAAYPTAVGRVLRETAKAVGIDIEGLLAGSTTRARGGSSASARRTLTPKPMPAAKVTAKPAAKQAVDEPEPDNGPLTDPLGGPRTARFGGSEEGSPA